MMTSRRSLVAVLVSRCDAVVAVFVNMVMSAFSDAVPRVDEEGKGDSECAGHGPEGDD